MSRATDRYREWDAAYVLGALSPDERREYEAHLAGCEECAAAVAELAGMPGLLAAVDAKSIDVSVGEGTEPATLRPVPDLLPRVLAAARSERRRSRRVITGALVAVAAVSAAVALVLPAGLGGGDRPGGASDPVSAGSSAPPSEAPDDLFIDERVDMGQVVPSPLSADFRLAAESWGSRIETRCRYSANDMRRPVYNVGEQGYGLYVTDTSGEPTVVATWSAGPGSNVDAVGTTRLRRHEIARVDIRSLATGQVLLASTIGG